MKNFSWICLVTLMFAGCSLSDDGDRSCLSGEGGLVLESRILTGDFTAVDHRIPGNLFITQGTEVALTVRAQQNLLPFLSTNVSNGTLFLSFTECLDNSLPFVIDLTVTDLESVALEGIGDIVFNNEVQADNLELSLVGQGNMELLGSAQNLEINLSGQGNARAFAMPSDVCDVNILGQGNVEVTVDAELNVVIDGQGNVFYKGNPVVTSLIKGQGEIIDAN